MDLWLTNVQLETSYLKEGDWSYGTKTENTAIGINDGKIAEIVPMSEWQAGENQLLLPGLIEKHCHLDKSKLGTPWRPVTPAASLVERFETEIPQLDALPLSIKERGQALIDLELPHGAVMFRSHIDIEPMTQLRYFDAITELVAEQPFGSELVLFPQHGLLRSNAASLIEELAVLILIHSIKIIKLPYGQLLNLLKKGMSVLTSIFMIGKKLAERPSKK